MNIAYKKLKAVVVVTFLFMLSGLLVLYFENKWVSLPGALNQILAFFQSDTNESENVNRHVLVRNSLKHSERPGLHGYEYACSSESPSGIKELPKGKIYRWQDDGGGVHFGDRAPDTVSYDIVDMGFSEKDYFDLLVRYPQGRVPTNINNLVSISGKAIYEIYEQYLTPQNMSKSSIEVLVYGDSTAYHRYKKQVAKGLKAPVDGFYSSALNQAVVLHKGDVGRTHEVSLHETTHVINARNFGLTPKWFNEGMAEFFEHTHVSGQLITIVLSDDWLDTLGKGHPFIPLKSLLNSTYADWETKQRNTYYANSWALAYFLMMPKNKSVMAAYQLELAKDPCDQTDSINFFQNTYPGGIALMERDLKKWFVSDSKQAVSF